MLKDIGANKQLDFLEPKLAKGLSPAEIKQAPVKSQDFSTMSCAYKSEPCATWKGQERYERSKVNEDFYSHCVCLHTSFLMLQIHFPTKTTCALLIDT